MDRTIGVIAGERIAAAVVAGEEILSGVCHFPNLEEDNNELLSMPMEGMAQTIARVILETCGGNLADAGAIGIGFPGIIKDSVIVESPNLRQAKGSNLKELVGGVLREQGFTVPVHIYNSADVTAAGLAATRGQLERFIRVWTLGTGVGYGRYPHTGAVLEGGHLTVSLDPKEGFCGCGGKGHLEGIVGHRAMRLRFLDMEPEEVFECAAEGDQRCLDFVRRWHKALAAATATCIHLEGPGKFYISGFNARFVQPVLLNQYLSEFVTMLPLQGSGVEVVTSGDEVAIVGAAVNARRAA